MKTLDELKERQAQEIASFEQEQAIKAALAEQGIDTSDAIISIHRDHVSAKLWSDFRTSKTLVDACAIVDKFKDSIVDGKHWKDGSVSTWPEEINTNAKRENAVMDGSHAVEIKVEGGKGYGPYVIVKFWTRVAEQLCEISCPVSDCWTLVPSVRGQYDRYGQFSGRVEWNPAETQIADSFRKFWSEPPAYQGSYYLADVPNFESWASNHGKLAAK